MKTGAQLLVETLQVNGAEIGFGVPGESYLAVLDALYDAKADFRFIGCRNEGGGAFMAEAYGKLTGKPGLLFVTRGPGITNASIGIHTAMQNSSPMVVFVGQIATSLRGREAFQEVDYKQVFGGLAKWVVEIDSADRVPELVSRALTVAQSGRPGPVVVALPEDMLVQKSDARIRPAVTPIKPHASLDDATAIMERIAQAERPVVIVGGGGWNENGRTALQTWTEANKLPVVAAFRCQDLIDNSSPSYAGDAGVGMPPHIRSFLEESDLIVCINARFGEMLTDAWTLFDPTTFDTPLIHIHAGEAELGKIFTPEIAVMSCPNAACTMLSRTEHLSDPVWAERTVQQHDVWAATIDAPQQTGAVDMAEVMQIIRDTLPVDAIVTNGAGNFAIWPGRHIVYGRDMTMLAPQSGAMGAGVPAAIMAKLVQPDRFALSFAGDGDFQMNCQELGTAMQHDAAPVILVLNNGTYGTIRMHQERDYPRRVSGTEIVNPDFAALAQSYGFHGETVRETSDFADAWKRACASPTGAVLELVTDAEAITPRTTISALRGDG